DPVEARQQRGDAVVARAVGDRRAFLTRVLVADGDGRTRERASLGVAHDPAEGGCGLCQQRDGREQRGPAPYEGEASTRQAHGISCTPGGRGGSRNGLAVGGSTA